MMTSPESSWLGSRSGEGMEEVEKDCVHFQCKVVGFILCHFFFTNTSKNVCYLIARLKNLNTKCFNVKFMISNVTLAKKNWWWQVEYNVQECKFYAKSHRNNGKYKSVLQTTKCCKNLSRKTSFMAG